MDINDIVLPRLRPELRFNPVHENKQTCYVIEDPVRNQFYRTGFEEYLLISGLANAASIEQLLTTVEERSGTRLTTEQALMTFEWLARCQLVQQGDTERLSNIISAEQAGEKLKTFSKLNLITFKIGLFNPDPLLDRIAPYLLWFTGRTFFIVWLVAGLAALTLLSVNWQLFTTSAAGIFSPGNMLMIWFVWFGLKILHELSHSLVCKRYGGRVYEAGILMIIFIPLTYVNATSSWKFPSRWQRIHVATAGMYIELFAAWLAILYWVSHPHTSGGQLAHNTFIVAGISSLLFNANPLMRFDGYYILSDLVGIPNLYGRSMQAIHNCIGHWFLGTPLISQKSDHPVFFPCYAVGIFFWRILILFSLGYAAILVGGAFGGLIVTGAILVWLGIPLYMFFKRLPDLKKQNPAILRHLSIRLAITGMVVFVLLQAIGWQQTITIPAVVLYQDQYNVKTETSGFVAEILISDGSTVHKGDRLLVLDNPDLQARMGDIRLQLEQALLKSRLAHSSGLINQYQILQEQVQTLQDEQQAVDEDIEKLIVATPGDGTILVTNLNQLQGRWLSRGTDILWIVDSGKKHIRGSAGQDDITQLRNQVGKEVAIDMRSQGLGRFSGMLERIAPRASRELPHPALSAINGGPLDVRKETTGFETDTGRASQYLLFAPRFTFDVAVHSDLLQKLREGQQASIHIDGGRRTLSMAVRNQLTDWLNKKKRVMKQNN
jgi:putative peptide zinc metalloprotease protein